MGTHPSKRFEDGVLIERAIASEVAGDSDPGEDLTQRDYREPDRSTMADRLKARTTSSRKSKAVEASDAENKSVKRTAKK
jgi:hypothetical protein